MAAVDGDTGTMSRYYNSVLSQQGNPEFANPVPTNGYGDVEASVYKSIAAIGFLPRPVTTPLPARKACKIFSPVSSPGRAVMLAGWRESKGDNPSNYGRECGGSRRESHTKAAATPAVLRDTADSSYAYRGRITSSDRGVTAQAVAAHVFDAEGSSSNGNVAVTRRDFDNRRPSTSDSWSRAMDRSRFDDEGRALAAIDGQALTLRPSSSGGGGGLRNSGSGSNSSGADQRGHAIMPGWVSEEGNRTRVIRSRCENIVKNRDERERRRKGARSGWSEKNDSSAPDR